jgi:hypothetical protein
MRKLVVAIILANVLLALAVFVLRPPWLPEAEEVPAPVLPAQIEVLQEAVASGDHDEPYAVTLSDAELTATRAYYAARSPNVPFTRIQASTVGNRVAVDAVTRGLAVPVPVQATVALSTSHGVLKAQVDEVRVAGAGLPTFIHDQVLGQANASLDLSRYDLPLTVDAIQLRPGSFAFSGRLK